MGLKNRLESLFPTLGKKIVAAVTFVLLIAGGSFAFYAHRTGYAILEQHARAKARGVAEFGKAILEHIMLEGKSSHLQDALTSAISSGEAKDIYILRPDGEISLSARGPNISKRLSLTEFREYPIGSGERFRSARENDSLYEYIVTPIIKKPACYRCHPEPQPLRGYLAVKVSMDDVLAVSRQHRVYNILITAFLFPALGGVIFLALLYLVIRPIKNLRSEIVHVEKQLETMEQGERVQFQLLEAPPVQDEIGELITAFNKLLRRLNEAHAKLYEVHQKQLEQADRLATAGEMAASLAHEIKNPLSGVLGALHVFDDEMPKTDPRKEIMREMIAQLKRISQAVRDLLSYARPSPAVFEDVHLNDVVERTLSLLKPQYAEKHLVVELSLDTTMPSIRADGKLVQQLIWNITLNALQAMEAGGTLSVTTRHDGSLVKIQIKDSGEGIPEENRAIIFKPFFTTKHKGTGLGLAICKRIVEQHNGRIHLESEPGKGTTVTVELPIIHE